MVESGKNRQLNKQKRWCSSTLIQQLAPSVETSKPHSLICSNKVNRIPEMFDESTASVRPPTGFAIITINNPKKLGEPWITKGQHQQQSLGLILSIVTVGAYGGPRPNPTNPNPPGGWHSSCPPFWKWCGFCVFFASGVYTYGCMSLPIDVYSRYSEKIGKSIPKNHILQSKKA